MTDMCNEINNDCFNEEEAQAKLLSSKPACFIILGKPGCGKTTLARKFAKAWNCQYVGGQSSVSLAVDYETELGNKAKELLLEGGSVPESMVIQILEERLQSPDVLHHGYILDDFPTISEDYLSITDQLELLKRLNYKPDYVINIKIPDNDLINRKKGFKVDPLTNEIYTREFYDLKDDDNDIEGQDDVDEDGEEEEEDDDEDNQGDKPDDELGEEEMEPTPVDIIERLMKRREDIEENIIQGITNYKNLLLPQLEDFMGDHDAQKLIELDGNLPPKTLLKELLVRMNFSLLHRAYVPFRLQGGEDQDDIPDDTDTDDMLRSLAAAEMIAPGFRWRRSRWGRFCPVSLFEGNIALGSPQFAVSFLDKMYMMATSECLDKFLRCPRKYLQAPQPRPPCKLCILGPPLSGKTTLANSLGEIYSAKVFDMRVMMESKFKETRHKLIEDVRKEALENAIHRTVSLQQQEKAAMKKEEEEEEEENEEEETDAEKEENNKFVEEKEDPVVDENHPEVKRLVEEAVIAANSREITIGTDTYIDVLEAGILDWYKEMQENDQSGRIAGNWILENFPETREQLNAMTERGIVPDDIICFKDSSEENSCLLQRWQLKNYPEEQATKTGEDSVENIIDTKEATSNQALIADDEDFETSEKDNEAGESEQPKDSLTDEEGKATDDTQELERKPDAKETSLPSNTASSTSLEQGLEEFRKAVLYFDKNWMAIQTSARNSNGLEPILVDCSLEPASIMDDVVRKITGNYQYKGWEYTGMDQDEEEEDLEEDEDLDEEEQEDDAFRGDRRKPFGDTRHFCPIQLKENYVLWPGSPECAAKYKERVYFFSSPDARVQFLENPDSYLADKEPLKPPALRILLLGPKGAGKTTHGRNLAKKFGVFHISFHELLQEKILSKTKKRIGPDYPEDDIKEEETSEEEKGENDQAPEVKESSGQPKEASSESEAPQEGEVEKADGEAEKEPEVELTEIEENIRDNILDSEPLSKTTLESILPPFWKEEPYSSTGFILEGFPRTTEDVHFLSDNGLFPDCAVFLGVEDIDIISRLMPPLLAKWKKKRDIHLAKKQKELLIKKKKREEERQRRIEEKTAVLTERKAERLREKELRKEEGEDSDEDEEEEEEEEEDVEGLVDAEMAEEDEEDTDAEEDEETEGEAIERIKGELTDRFDDAMQSLGFVRDTLEEVMIPRIDIEAGRKPHVVQFVIEKTLKPAMENRDSLFDSCQSISSALAKKMLIRGNKQSTKFGRWCPVKLMDGDILPPFETAKKPLFPVVHRQFIYFLSSEEARDQFVSCPSKYTFQPPPLPSVPVRVAIIGPPKSGKTTLAKRLSEEYGLVRLSIGEAVRIVLYTQDNTELSSQIQEHLRSGLTIPDELAVQALEIASLDVQCQTRGYVLDGYPLTENQVRLLTAKSIIPYVTFELRISDTSVLTRGAKDRVSVNRVYALHDSQSILTIKVAHYHREVPFVRNWYQEQHRNLFVIDGERSKWWIWEAVTNHLKHVVNEIRVYVDRSAKGLASRISDLCITPDELEGRLGAVGHYCPVSLIDRGELVDCSEQESLEFAAEFRGHYFRFASEKELEIFLETPEKYVPPLASRSLPEPHLLPQKRNGDVLVGEFPSQLELQGYCPVTYMDGDLRYEALKTGDPSYIVEYKDSFYACCTAEKREKFMRLPEKYSNIVLPRKLPPRKEPVPIANLPMIGYMEQSVSVAITKAMTAAGCFKPKYPFLTPRQSALLYVAYHLKAYNPKGSDYVRKKYKQKLKQFEERCQLIKYLGKIMTPKYCEPEDRPTDFDHKLLSFISLKGIPPAAKWLT